MPTAINSNYSPYTGKTNDENKKETDKKKRKKA
ncbi:flagellar hook capping protein [Clostridium sporogenes]|nr:flagellar hook capping protein [Clostridium sporogenes]